MAQINAPYLEQGAVHAPYLPTLIGRKFEPSTPNARGGAAINKEEECSSTKDTWVYLEVTCNALTATKIEIEINKVRIINNEISAAVSVITEVPFGFLVPAGGKWIIKPNAGIKEAFRNYQFLN